MEHVLTLIISMTACLVGGILRKDYTRRAPGGLLPVLLFNVINALACALVLFLWDGFPGASQFTLFLGIAFGLVTALQAVTNLLALQIGPMSYTTLIVSFSTLISAVSGALFFGESIGVSQIVGIALMLISFLLAVERKEGENKTSMRWLLLCLVAFFSCGGIGVMQKIHQSSPYRQELGAFLIIAFAACFAASAVFCLILWRKQGKSAGFPVVSGKAGMLLLGGMILCGVCSAINNKLNLYLSGVMDSAVFFPIVNGGGLVLSTLAAVVLFRERLTPKQWIGVATGILSVLLLAI